MFRVMVVRSATLKGFVTIHITRAARRIYPKCAYTFAQRDTRLWLCPLSSKLVGSDDGCTYVEDQEGLMMVVAVLRSFSPKLMQAIMFAGGQSFYRMLEDLL